MKTFLTLYEPELILYAANNLFDNLTNTLKNSNLLDMASSQIENLCENAVKPLPTNYIFERLNVKC